MFALLLVKMAVYIVVSVLFGLFIGYMYASAKFEEKLKEILRKNFISINDKNSIIMKLNNEVKALKSKVKAISEGYDLQTKLVDSKDKELSKRLQELKLEHRRLSLELSKKLKMLDEKDEIISFLKSKMGEIAS